MELSANPCRSGRCGAGGQGCAGGAGGFGGSVRPFVLNEEAELIHISSQVEDQGKEVVPAEGNHRYVM